MEAFAAAHGIPFLGHVPLDAPLLQAFERGDMAAVAAASAYPAVAAVAAAVQGQLRP